MSLEAILAANTDALGAHTAALAANTAILERVVAGQQAALEKIDSGRPATPRAAPKKDAAPAATTAQAAAATETAPVAAATSTPAASITTTEPTVAASVVTDADLKSAATAWMDGKSQDERLDAVKKLNSVLEHFGLAGSKITGPDSKLDDDQRKQARFFVRRWAAGLEVNFSADYDFDGEPTQGAPTEANDPLG